MLALMVLLVLQTLLALTINLCCFCEEPRKLGAAKTAMYMLLPYAVYGAVAGLDRRPWE